MVGFPLRSYCCCECRGICSGKGGSTWGILCVTFLYAPFPTPPTKHQGGFCQLFKKLLADVSLYCNAALYACSTNWTIKEQQKACIGGVRGVADMRGNGDTFLSMHIPSPLWAQSTKEGLGKHAEGQQYYDVVWKPPKNYCCRAGGGDTVQNLHVKAAHVCILPHFPSTLEQIGVCGGFLSFGYLTLCQYSLC